MAGVDAPPNMVVFTSTGVGHVVPVAQLAARLAVRHGFTATVSFTNLSSPEHSSAPLATLLVAISVAKLREVSLDDLPRYAHRDLRHDDCRPAHVVAPP
jgi:hydroquinone glucosyltransferase